MRILVVDDNPDLLSTMCALLESFGFEVLQAPDGPTALSLMVQPDHVDVLLTDVVMPGMSGIDLGHQVRRLHPGIAIILTSGYTPSGYALPPSWVFLQKPFQFKDLLRALRNAFERPGRSPADHATAPATAPDNSCSVLLVEDSANDTCLALHTLDACGIPEAEVAVCEDGDDAWNYLLKQGKHRDRVGGNPRLVILDLKLPKMDGVELLKNIRSHPSLAGIPVVILTGSSLEPDIDRTRKLGISDYIVKPMGLQATLAALQPALHHVLSARPS